MKKHRDRIKELIRVKASELRANASNWREHGEQQKSAMSGILEEVGYVDGLIAVRDKKGVLTLVNGHMRKEVSGDEEVPVLVVDLTPAEVKKVLATFDPIGAMAKTQDDALAKLRKEVKSSNAAVQELLAGVAADRAQGKKDVTELKQLSTLPPPVMSWVLIGIPTVRFGEISERIEALAKVKGITLETTANNG